MQKDTNDDKNEYIHRSKEETFVDNVISRDRKALDCGDIQETKQQLNQEQQQQPRRRHKKSTLPPNLSPLKKKGRSSSASSSGSQKGSKWYDKSRRLGMDFSPAAFDVICARGNVAWNHRKFSYVDGDLAKAAITYYMRSF